MPVIVFSCMSEVSLKQPLCIFDLLNCFNSFISDLQDSCLSLKLHQVQKQLSSWKDSPSKKVQQITIITTTHTDFWDTAQSPEVSFGHINSTFVMRKA